MVELRSRTQLHSQLHYIRAIKDGSVKLVVNVVARGKSKLRFRQLSDLYIWENIKDDESIPRIVRDLDNVYDMTQGSCGFGAEASIKAGPEDFDITLDKIRTQCKEKKRKLASRGDTKTASQVKVKHESLTLQTEDERCDLEEPLSSWNTEFSKRRKKKQERKIQCSSTSSQSAKKVDLPVSHEIKPEASWDDSYSVPEVMVALSPDHLLDSNKRPDSTTNTDLVEDVMHRSSKDGRLAPYCSAEPNSPGMVATEELVTTKPADEAIKDASEEFNVVRKARCCLADNIDRENQANVVYSSVSREDIELEAPQSSESETIGCVKNLICSNTGSGGEEVKENEQSNDSKPSSDVTITGLDIVKTEAPGVLATDYSGLLTKDFGVENTEIVCENEDIAEDELAEATDMLQLTSCCNSLDNMHLVPDDSTILSEENHLPERLQQSSSSGNVDDAGDHKSSKLFQAPNEVKTAEETDSIQQQELHSQPEKLLSGRKALSPTSQAKLRKAMEHPDSPEKRCKRSEGKLYFSSQTSHRILKAQGLDGIDRVEVIPNSKQAIRKANNNTQQTQYQRANKFPRRDTQATKQQPFSTGCASLQGCARKAIDFSQGQIRDFQYVAAKLTKELKSMRQITKSCLLAESNTSNMSECNLDEVKTLIRNAERTEESSKKWLSIIERDCNRFCKIMGMVREDSPCTDNTVQKKKKIRFADDAGGDLCHVKVFDLDLESKS